MDDGEQTSAVQPYRTNYQEVEQIRPVLYQPLESSVHSKMSDSYENHSLANRSTNLYYGAEHNISPRLNFSVHSSLYNANIAQENDCGVEVESLDLSRNVSSEVQQPFNPRALKNAANMKNKTSNSCYSIRSYSPCQSSDKAVLSESSQQSRSHWQDGHIAQHMCSSFNTKYEGNYICGLCQTAFSTICKLHYHLEIDHEALSYIYYCKNKIAWPQYESVCSYTQTDEDDLVQLENRNSVSTDTATSQETDIEETTRDYDACETFTADSAKQENSMDTHVVAPEDVSLTQQKLKQKVSKKSRIKTEKRGQKSKFKDQKSKKKKLERRLKKTARRQPVSQSRVLKAEHSRSVNETACALERETEEPRTDLNETEMNSDSDHDNLVDNQTSEMLDEPEGYCLVIMKDLESSVLGKLAVKVEKVTSTSNSDQKYRHRCNICMTGYNTEQRLYLHLKKVHENTENDQDLQTCQWCGESFPSVKSYKSHSRQCKRSNNRTCFLCQQTFNTPTDLTDHLVMHRNNNELICNVCEKSFTEIKPLQTHLKRHTLPKYIQCEFCGKGFISTQTLKKHLRYCNKERDVQCSECEKKFKTRESLKNHMSMHSNDRPFVCHICGYAGKKAMYLARHIRSHTGEKPYKCHECGQAFAAPNGLNRHKWIHSNNKPCVCNFCGKEFTTNWNLKTHIRQHTLETPYRCNLCNKAFKQNVLLKLHNRTHHPEKMMLS